MKLSVMFSLNILINLQIHFKIKRKEKRVRGIKKVEVEVGVKIKHSNLVEKVNKSSVMLNHKS